MTTHEALSTLQNDPVAQQLLQSTTIARLAYVWRDGTPRVVPMWFHWTGETLLMGAPPNSPKMKVLDENAAVALSIDTEHWPHKVLTVRGSATVEVVPGFFPEYEAMARRYLGEEGGHQAMVQFRRMFSRWTRITIHPESVRIIDFETRFPSAWSAGSGSS